MKASFPIALFLFLMIFAHAAGFAEDPPGLVNYLGNPQYPDDFWQVSSPENEGMDGGKLRESLDNIKENNLHIHSFLVIKNGKLVFERYGADYKIDQDYIQSSKMVQLTPDDRHHLWSTTKTFTSALIGIAIAEGRIPSVKAQVMSYFHDDAIENMDANKRMITVEDLLTMRSGIYFDENSPDWDLFFTGPPNTSLSVLNKPMRFEERPAKHRLNTPKRRSSTRSASKPTFGTPIKAAPNTAVSGCIYARATLPGLGIFI